MNIFLLIYLFFLSLESYGLTINHIDLRKIECEALQYPAGAVSRIFLHFENLDYFKSKMQKTKKIHLIKKHRYKKKKRFAKLALKKLGIEDSDYDIIHSYLRRLYHEKPQFYCSNSRYKKLNIKQMIDLFYIDIKEVENYKDICIKNIDRFLPRQVASNLIPEVEHHKINYEEIRRYIKFNEQLLWPEEISLNVYFYVNRDYDLNHIEELQKKFQATFNDELENHLLAKSYDMKMLKHYIPFFNISSMKFLVISQKILFTKK